MDTLWWGSVFVFGGGCVAAVRTGANKDSAYGRMEQKEEKEALKALEEKKKKGREEIERERERERERKSVVSMMRSRLSKEEDEDEELSSGDDVFRKCWITSLNSSSSSSSS